MKKSTFGLLFIALSFFILNCGSTDDLNPKDIINEGFIINFNAEHGTGSDIEFSDSQNPIVINKGESVVFKNTSIYQIEYADGTVKETDISDISEWEFEGGSPVISQMNTVTVTYSTAGKFDVTLYGEHNGEKLGALFIWYVEVIDDEAEQESLCLIGKEETSDGFETEFLYELTNDGIPVLNRANKRAGGILKEYSLYEFELDTFAPFLYKELFYNQDGKLLGDITYTRDSENRIESQIKADASGNIIEDFDFNFDPSNKMIINAILKAINSQGVSYTADIAYTYDANKENVIEETATQNGSQLWRIEYEYDDKINLFSGLEIQKFPERGSANNLTSVLTYNQNDVLINTRISTYIYETNGESPCIDRPISEERTVNGVINIFTYTNVEY